MARVTDLNTGRGRSRRQLAYFFLCALVALCGALLFAGRDARAQQLGDVANGVTQQSGDATGGGAQSPGGGGGGETQTSSDGAVVGTDGGTQGPVDASGGGGTVNGQGGSLSHR